MHFIAIEPLQDKSPLKEVFVLHGQFIVYMNILEKKGAGFHDIAFFINECKRILQHYWFR